QNRYPSDGPVFSDIQDQQAQTCAGPDGDGAEDEKGQPQVTVRPLDVRAQSRFDRATLCRREQPGTRPRANPCGGANRCFVGGGVQAHASRPNRRGRYTITTTIAPPDTRPYAIMAVGPIPRISLRLRPIYG